MIIMTRIKVMVVGGDCGGDDGDNGGDDGNDDNDGSYDR
jgi:hypothetical protein